ncbi:unnamed protein product [Prunus armeniaca]|uniref:Uncharacterized protein n=1 Tax=Prunus armeniaca TaxID=36596 RepID=A0A6J5Y876_PRUAR|nr:unnamed protein product [Prunus armeniaca]
MAEVAAMEARQVEEGVMARVQATVLWYLCSGGCRNCHSWGHKNSGGDGDGTDPGIANRAG